MVVHVNIGLNWGFVGKGIRNGHLNIPHGVANSRLVGHRDQRLGLGFTLLRRYQARLSPLFLSLEPVLGLVDVRTSTVRC